jgi:hypothetical protein
MLCSYVDGAAHQAGEKEVAGLGEFLVLLVKNIERFTHNFNPFDVNVLESTRGN